MAKPYRRISELPELVREINEIYQKLLNAKREEIISEIQAAMGEIHRTADIKQAEIVQRADSAFTKKRKSAENADRLTNLDAMRIPIANLRQQYIKKLLITEQPDVNTVTINRSTVCPTVKLQNEEDIDKYPAEIRKKLVEKLNGHDVLHII